MARTRLGRLIARETGMALAVLALWMMSLLVPLHQTSGLLRELAKAGHDISAGWSVCVTLAQDEDGSDHLIPVCPAQGIGKSDVAALPPVIRLADFVPVVRDLAFRDQGAPPHRPQNFTPGQPRGPPAQV